MPSPEQSGGAVGALLGVLEKCGSAVEHQLHRRPGADEARVAFFGFPHPPPFGGAHNSGSEGSRDETAVGGDSMSAHEEIADDEVRAPLVQRDDAIRRGRSAAPTRLVA